MEERKIRQIKGALLKCAEENRNKPTPTFNQNISALCTDAELRIRELEEENARMKKDGDDLSKKFDYQVKRVMELEKQNEELKDKVEMYDFFYEGNGFKRRGLNNAIQIAEYINKLEKKNAELNMALSKVENEYDVMFWKKNDIIAKAKEIINDCVCELQNILFYKMRNKERIASTLDKAEQFLKDSEVEK